MQNYELFFVSGREKEPGVLVTRDMENIIVIT
jgi:hypothetical protein